MSDTVAEAPADKPPYYCPGCGARYDTPGVCTGPVESGHAPMAVLADDEPVPSEAPAGGIAPVEGVTNEPFDPAVAGVPTIAQHSAVVAKVSNLEGAFGALHEDIAAAIAFLGGRIQQLENRARAESDSSSAPSATSEASVSSGTSAEAGAATSSETPATGFTPAADGEATVAPPEGWPGT